MKDIFVSYRRSDSSDVTGRIFDQMKARFGQDRLFKDVDSIPLGKDFRTVISEAVGQCQVLLAVIGKDWLSVTGDGGRRRIDDPDDYVHLEIAAALNRHIPVIPVLVENVSMPRSADLPEPLRDLAFRNGTPVRSDPDFHHDMERLCSQLAGYLPKERGWRGTKPGKRRVWIFGGAAVLAILLALGYFWPVKTAPIVPALKVDTSNIATSQAPVPIRFWIKDLPEVPGEDATKLFSNALGSWQAVVVTPIRKADSEAEANVIIDTSAETTAIAQLGPPKSGASPLIVQFGTTVPWTPHTFEAASSRMLGHILGLTYTEIHGQMMSERAELETLPLTPQDDDIKRVRQIWGQ